VEGITLPPTVFATSLMASTSSSLNSRKITIGSDDDFTNRPFELIARIFGDEKKSSKLLASPNFTKPFIILELSL